ncbi:unnamed protein product [Ambrosiozyma monospora]|uniref:Unnamed protein product n=1 Tax=Ambrosiozyma monospora TaxID=43982 RepID=A0ACB5T0T3_AMBMO|nr:unnamed protein product [Ambrosiozyma monospora]
MHGFKELHHIIIDDWANLSDASKLVYIKTTRLNNMFTIVNGGTPESTRLELFMEDILHVIVKFFRYIDLDDLQLEFQHYQPSQRGLFPDPETGTDFFVGSIMELIMDDRSCNFLLPLQIYEFQKSDILLA